jgi:hypothetical protein
VLLIGVLEGCVTYISMNSNVRQRYYIPSDGRLEYVDAVYRGGDLTQWYPDGSFKRKGKKRGLNRYLIRGNYLTGYSYGQAISGGVR